MYNENLKRRFIKSYSESDTTKYVCTTLFNAIEKYEFEAEKDVACFSCDELKPIIDEMMGVRSKSKLLRISILKDYARWCAAADIPGSTMNIFNVDITGLNKIRRTLVSGPLHLQKCLDEIYDPESLKSTDNIRRCFLWLAFSGMPENEIVKVKVSDVDFENMAIVFNGSVYPIYREAIPTIKNCVELSSFRYIHPNYPPDKIVWKNRVDGEQLIRGVKAPPSISGIRVDISRTIKAAAEAGKTQAMLSYYRAWMSGLFYRTAENERAGIPADFSDITVEYMDGRVYKLDSGRNTREAKFRQLANEYMKDYQRWKLAFSI